MSDKRINGDLDQVNVFLLLHWFNISAFLQSEAKAFQLWQAQRFRRWFYKDSWVMAALRQPT